jgi:hypothetical protein
MIVAILALFVALGGTVYAASTINGKTIKKNTLPGNRIKQKTVTGNRLKNDAITGAQVNEATLGKVPSATTADSATTAGTAQTAVTAETAKTALSPVPPAYAHILSSGAVDGANSHNITDANVTHPEEGVYCLSGLSVKPHVILAEVDSADGPGVTEASVNSNGFACPPDAIAEIVTYDPSTIDFTDYGAGFYVVIY